MTAQQEAQLGEPSWIAARAGKSFLVGRPGLPARFVISPPRGWGADKLFLGDAALVIDSLNALAGIANPAGLPALLAACEAAELSYDLWVAKELPAEYKAGSVPSVLDAWKAVWAALALLRAVPVEAGAGA